MMTDKPPIVIDNGSFTVKAGLASYSEPSLHVAPIVGKAPSRGLRHKKLAEKFVGKAAEELETSLDLKLHHPIEKGIITSDWNSMEAIWDHTFRALEVQTSEHFLLMSESPLNNRFKRRKLAEIMFEKFDVKGLYIANTANLAMYGSGRSVSVVVDSGADVTHISPVYNGYTLKRQIQTVNVGGETLTDYLKYRLGLRGYAFPGYADLNSIREMKEQLCFVAEDYDMIRKQADTSTVFVKSFQLRNDQCIKLNDERFRVPELLVKPHKIRCRPKNLAGMIHKVISSTDVILRKEFYENIILAGGNTMFPGLVQRLENDLTGLAPPDVRIKVHAAPDRVNLAWRGAAALVGSDEFDSFWVTRQEYEEKGLRSIVQKFML